MGSRIAKYANWFDSCTSDAQPSLFLTPSIRDQFPVAYDLLNKLAHDGVTYSFEYEGCNYDAVITDRHITHTDALIKVEFKDANRSSWAMVGPGGINAIISGSHTQDPGCHESGLMFAFIESLRGKMYT